MRARLRDPRLVPAFAVAALCGVSLVLRGVAGAPNIWIDEAISAGIATKPLHAIPGVLLEDGSPPLYYVLLHGWIALFGDGARAMHGLSTLFALACVPAAFWAASPLGRRTAWIAAVVAALGPYLTLYAVEARMYTLVALLSVVVTGAVVRVLRDDARRRDVALLAVALAALLYAHNWGLFLAGATGLACVVEVARAEAARRGALARRTATALGLAALMYLPWVPTLLDQAAHTGAPWSGPPPDYAVSDVLKTLAGVAVLAPLSFAALAGLVALRREGDGGERRAARALALVLGGCIALALLAVTRHPGWAPRYYGVALGPVLVLLAAGTARAGRVGLLALAVAAVGWLSPPGHGDPDAKSNVASLTSAFRPQLRPGDLVISSQPEQLSALRFLLGPSLRYASPLGPVRDPAVMNWRDVVARLEASSPDAALAPALARLAPGAHVLFVRPTGGVAPTAPRYVRLIEDRSDQVGALLAADRRFAQRGASQLGARPGTEQISSVEARLYVRGMAGT